MIRLLVIDDHEMVREGLKAMLTAEPDFDIVGDAANAEQAFELIKRLRPDVILLDVRLPGVSGIEICRTVAERYPEIAVIIVTTFTDETLVAQCIQAGARGFIVKDIERFDLKRSIRAVARGEAAIDPKAAVAVLAHLRRAPAGDPAPGEHPHPYLVHGVCDDHRIYRRHGAGHRHRGGAVVVARPLQGARSLSGGGKRHAEDCVRADLLHLARRYAVHLRHVACDLVVHQHPDDLQRIPGD